MKNSIIVALAVAACLASAGRAESASPYVLVFDDEFNGTTVDTSKWNILTNGTIGGGYSSDQFSPASVTVGNGTLNLAASKGTPSGRPYGAGFVFTKQCFQYGYFEERALMPRNGHGMWPAFWMNNGGNYPEIDVLEWLGNTPTQQWSTLHPVNDTALTGGAGLGATVNGPNYAGGYHVYGMLWAPNAITWYIDGIQTFRLTQGETYKGVVVQIPSTPMQVILNSAVGGWNNNAVDSTTVFPSLYQVGDVHIYSSAPGATAIAPQLNYIMRPSVVATSEQLN